ncbi:splicing factor U2AF 50 kDa subunit [Drosophila biarmipes]|uniref:splicing factor U2AF 50 kDa subunit n=1 Tax=Drosophila biarmipes TaxID=125945 RepID=UPI0007E714AF|nr:splicing factor U2AF 50 kDa subunit [Drosophila biarmipes]
MVGRRSQRNRSRSYRSRSRSKSRPRPTRSDTIFSDRPRLERRPGHAPSSWDIPATGYEHLTPLQYKAMQASGQIASRIVPDAVPTGESAAIAMVTRQARRLYVGNIPFGVTEEDMMDFFNNQIMSLGLNASQGLDSRAVLTCQTNLEKNFAFLEFRSMDEATQAITFDGISFRGQILKIRRPHDYQAVPAFCPPEAESSLDFKTLTNPLNTPSTSGSASGHVISSVVPDSPNKIYVGGLPTCLDEAQIKELLLSFGKLRGFNLVKDSQTTLSKGFAFFEYVDPTVTEQAIAGLHGMQLGERRLVVQRSIPGGKNGINGPPPVVQVPGISTLLSTGSATEVLCMFNMVLPEELLDDEEYEDISSDIKQECTKYGEVRSLKIPRPIGPAPQRGCGKVFVQFETVEDCQRALKSISGRKFSGRIVMTSFYDPEKYLANDLQ